MTSWRVDLYIYGGTTPVASPQRFPTEQMAKAYGRERRRNWTAVTSFMVEPTDDPPNATFVDRYISTTGHGWRYRD